MADTRIIVDVFRTGLSYADRGVRVSGDYKRVAFLSFSTLDLTIEQDCPDHLRAEIQSNAARLQTRRGELYTVPGFDHVVELGRGC